MLVGLRNAQWSEQQVSSHIPTVRLTSLVVERRICIVRPIERHESRETVR